MYAKFALLIELLLLWALLSSAAPYNEELAKRILPLASAAYVDDPQPCLKNVYGDAELVERYEPTCDHSLLNTCSAYLALLHSERVIAAVFRGTNTNFQLKLEAITSAFPKINFENMGKANYYFNNAFKRIWATNMSKNFDYLVKTYPDYKLWVTGHSLGAALSSLASAKILKDYPQFNMDNSAHYNYGQPRVGNKEFAESHDALISDFYRVVHAQDIVPPLPLVQQGYMHHRQQVWYNNSMASGSKYVLCTSEDDPACSDNVPRLSWDDHRHYFGILVTKYAITGCKAT